MTTVHERAAEELLSSILLDTKAAAVFAETRRRFAADDFDYEHAAVIGQVFRCNHPRNWPLDQIAAYLGVHTGIGAGYFAMADIEVGTTPAADREREENAAGLADIPEPFVASVNMTQNCGDQDGRLTWTEPILVSHSTGASFYDARCRDSWPSKVLTMRSIYAHSAPLEIGYTKPSRTLLHLLQNGSVARWPYDSTSIRLIIDLRRSRRPQVEPTSCPALRVHDDNALRQLALLP